MGGSGLKEGIRGRWGAGSGCGKQRIVLKSSLGDVNVVRRLLVDGAWDKKSWEDAVAWCSVGEGEEVRNEGRREVFASWALMVEALAVWYALAWAFDRDGCLWKFARTACGNLLGLLGFGASSVVWLELPIKKTRNYAAELPHCSAAWMQRNPVSSLTVDEDSFDFHAWGALEQFEIVIAGIAAWIVYEVGEFVALAAVRGQVSAAYLH
ncbi:hypothetical protein RHMOL_Rhmol08G0090000 [Rhododendron molle]|uniref:Uncharacterized protein n=1 Tax=Rhododendron molle TaxID=49168 RepID=A0ACC0MLP7_RHOML|nr:hypothetical protein RHMOL_Rhmol08G0090000 [Rhododendron molle]